MSFFSKSEYIELNLPFEYIDDIDDADAGLISLESSIDMEGARKYCFASFLVHHKDIDKMDDMIDLLKIPHEKTVIVKFKYKDGVYKDFKFDLDNLAYAYNDERFKRMELVCWGLNDKPAKEFS